MSIEPLNIYAGLDSVPNTVDDTNIIDTPPGGSAVQIEIAHSPPNNYNTAWENYFENTLGMTSSGPDTWEKQGVTRVIIKAWRITVINL